VPGVAESEGLMETWVLVLWLLTVDNAGPARPRAITYPTPLLCERAFQEAKSSKMTLVVGRSKCVRLQAVEAAPTDVQRP